MVLLVLASCGSDRRASSYRPPSNGCTRGSFLPCNCADGSDGVSTCDGERYGACVCDGTDAGGASSDASVFPDATASNPDATVPPPPPDGGFEDAGFVDSGVWPDAAPRDTGLPPDTGVRPDAGFPDVGFPDVGFPDAGVPPGPCNADSDCGAPIAVCENGQCIPGCFSQDPNGLVCALPEDCNPLTGRCGGLQLCFSDAECNPPVSVCQVIICVPGCAQPGAAPCASGTSCNPTTGRCS